MSPFDRDRLRWEAVVVPTERGPVHTRQWVPEGTEAVAAMVGGVGGGFDTPGRDLYPRLAEDLSEHGIGVLRVRFRDPRSLEDAVHDLRAGVSSISAQSVGPVALVGHSFGGAVVVRTALEMPVVAGVVTLATQSYGTEGAGRLQRPLLLIHGDADPTLPWRASADVARRAGGSAELEVLPGSGHGLVEHRNEVRSRVLEWLCAVLAPVS